MNAISPRAAHLIQTLIHDAPMLVNARLYKYYNFMEAGRFVQLWFHIPSHREVLSLVVWTSQEQRYLHMVYTDVLWNKLPPKDYGRAPYLHDHDGQIQRLVDWFLAKVNLVAIQPEHRYYTSRDADTERSVSHWVDAKRQSVHVQVSRPTGAKPSWWLRLKDSWRAKNPFGRPARYSQQEVNNKRLQRPEETVLSSET